MPRLNFFKPSLLLSLSFLIFSALGLSGCTVEGLYYGHAAELLSNKANEHLQKQDYPGAVSLLESALVLFPDSPQTQFNLALAYQYNHQYEKAQTLYEKLITTLPQRKQAILNQLGQSYQAQADELAEILKPAEPEANNCKPEQPKPDKKTMIVLYEKALNAYDKGLELPASPLAEEIQALRASADASLKNWLNP